MANRRAFTLIEMVVAMTVFTVFSYIVYDMFTGGIRAFQREEGKTESLESALLAYEYIANDLRRMTYYGKSAAATLPPLGISPDGDKFALPWFGEMDFSHAMIPKLRRFKIEYSLVPGDSPEYKFLKRNNKVIKAIKLTDLNISLINHKRSNDKDQTFISLKITGYGGRERDEYVLVSLFSPDSHNMRKIHPHFVERRENLSGGS